MRIIILVFNLTFFSTLLSSCLSIIGFRKDKNLTDKEIIRLADSFKLQKVNVYKINGQRFDTYVNSQKKISEKEKKYLIQPNQIIVYDRNKLPITFLVNCNIGGFPFLKWNRCHSMDSIPISQSYFIKPSFTIPIEELIKMIDLVENNCKILKEPDYYYFILWSRVLYRNSIKMLKEIDANIKRAKENGISISVYYIYSDSMYF